MNRKVQETDPRLPKTADLIEPVYQALKELDGEATNEQILAKVIEILRLPNEVAQISHLGSRTQTELSYRVAWAKTKLKERGAVTNPTSGTWIILQNEETEDPDRPGIKVLALAEKIKKLSALEKKQLLLILANEILHDSRLD